MKKIFTILALILTVSVFAQNSDAVVGALKSGDATKLSAYFDNTVDVKLPKQNEQQNVSKADAATTIKSFFSSNGVSSFELISQREMSGTMYIAGKLKSSAGDYNITVMLKNKNNQDMIITVRIN